MSSYKPAIAVLIPCLNEVATISEVVFDFRKHLPEAEIYVFDNDSSDETFMAARRAGAITRHVRRRGKGNVVRRMLADVHADIYIMVDGDGTYDASSSPKLVERLLTDGADMVNAVRVGQAGAFPLGHVFGNKILGKLVGKLFGDEISDLLSGYRALSNRFAKSFPALSSGFEIETELTIHALELRMPVAEVETPYFARVDTSSSKLRTYRDGLRILATIFSLFIREKPLAFFGSLGICLAIGSVTLALPLFATYLQSGLVPRFPTAILSSATMLAGLLFVACGLVLNATTVGRKEVKRLRYLEIPGASPKGLTTGLASSHAAGEGVAFESVADRV